MKILHKLAFAGLYLSATILEPVQAQMKDSEGNQYPTKVIGALEWTTENLKATRFRDGEAIPVVRSRSEWTKATRAARIAPDSNEAKVATLGYLQNSSRPHQRNYTHRKHNYYNRNHNYNNCLS